MLVREQASKKLLYTPNRWVPYHSPLLADISSALSHIESPIVLDLGSPSSNTVEYYSRFDTKVSVEDLRNDICRGASSEHTLTAAVDRIAQLGFQSACEVVMMWDLINYLPMRQRMHLAQCVERMTRPGALLHLSVWTTALMPESPLHFELLPEDEILYRLESPPTRVSPLITKPALAKLFPQFQRLRSFLSRTGIEEQLLIKTR